MGMVNSEIFGPYESGPVYHTAALGILKLPYQGESGSIVDSVSVILAVAIRGGGWTIGTVRSVDGQSALQSLQSPGSAYDSPTLGKDQQVDNMSDFVKTEADNGGVHTNSGILNKAAYLISEGGTFRKVEVGQGIGREKLGDLYMEVAKHLGTKRMTFTQFRSLVIRTSKEMYGANSAVTVQRAFRAVGL